MKNLNSYTSENFQKGCIHSQICSAGNDDLIYRKAYKGDWGDWDEMPESSNMNFYEISESKDSSVSDSNESEASYENSYFIM